MGKRFIKLYEQITEWEWYKDINTFRLFVHLLLKANYCDRDFHGKTVQRGQLVTSLPKLSTDVGLSIQQTRTALDHLKSTGEITDVSTTQNRVITIVNYDRYQSSTDATTEHQQTINRRSNRRSTDVPTSSIEYIEYKERVEKKNNKTPSVFKPPTLDEVREYCQERGKGVDPEKWFDFYSSKGFMIGKNKMKDWRAAVRTWEKNRDGSPVPANKPDARDVHGYEQRSYESEQQAAMARMMNDEWGMN